MTPAPSFKIRISLEEDDAWHHLSKTRISLENGAWHRGLKSKFSFEREDYAWHHLSKSEFGWKTAPGTIFQNPNFVQEDDAWHHLSKTRISLENGAWHRGLKSKFRSKAEGPAPICFVRSGLLWRCGGCEFRRSSTRSLKARSFEMADERSKPHREEVVEQSRTSRLIRSLRLDGLLEDWSKILGPLFC